MADLNVECYCRDVIDSYRRNVNHMDHDTARATTVYAASAIAADEGRARVDAAARVAERAIDRYARLANDGISHDRARETAAGEMAEKFDERGCEMKRQERGRFFGIGR
ncbi:hypothetical protein SAE02_69800 [Skermanella aerolata]|uniref:Uncharacterized protein n=1 Tax=Skermanella aerolata TaxID=393310 RepID=A0A512E289_9PROT|nr:hypothetical protein [Skermanella aerolata]KJB91252.1 hypothetical protein N826_31485 [Skermanella aerolata KACC 11604]GEO42832.1 hypothetical protein SAE02_69800 [Skermanella aerolata]